jgi:starch phosphorylase
MQATGNSFPVALAATRAGNLFTTHTAVSAGFDLFSPALIEQYLGQYARETLGISTRALLALGRKTPGNEDEPFNMAYLAVRGSGAVNGVSRLHGQVSRHIFAPLFLRWPEREVPVGYVTNGVHMPTWDSAAADLLWTEACGKNRWMGTSATIAADLRRVSDESLWKMRTAGRKALVEYAREGIGRQMASVGAPPEAIARTQARLDPEVMTLGFARRFADYKRPNLLLHDTDRLLSILNHPERPVQLILAGKAHPDDQVGQALIQEWTQFIGRNDGSAPVFFLADYDMLLAERLVQGVDVWINTPRRPWEASGTSGMKVLVNGGINVSELDGWWAEAYAPEVGWALGDGQEHSNDPLWDAAEASALYQKLEEEIIPEFFARTRKGIPTAWVARMRESMARLTPRFSASRTVREYTEQHYLPAASAYQNNLKDKGVAVRKRLDGHNALEQRLQATRFGTRTVETQGYEHEVSVEVFLNDVTPDMVRVELYADGVAGQSAVEKEMTPIPQIEGEGHVYRATVSSARPVTDYTARIAARHDSLASDVEAGFMLWQK